MTDYTLSFRTAVKGGRATRHDHAGCKGNEQQVNLDKLTVAALEGKTELTALLDWQQAISWRGELKLSGINTAKEVPDWPSKLDGLIKTRGSLYGGTWQIDVPEIKLTGNVKQNKVNVEGSLKGNSYLQWVIRVCTWRWGATRRISKVNWGERSEPRRHYRCAESG